jgi:signal transduction histidine kinase
VATEARSEPFSEAETMFAELIARMLEHELYRERTETQFDRMDNFASILSHDLRNPLTVAKGHLDNARDTGDSEDLRIVGESLDRIDELIDDVLTIARQGLQIDGTETVTLSEITDGCWGAVATGDAHLDVERDVTFRADRSRTKQLFENLFRNALEHGGSEVVVRVGALADGDGFYIEDDGPGIPEGERQKIFDAGYSTGGDGLGMGLAIVESVVTAHDWTITVTTRSDGGARFEIRDVISAPHTDK